MCHSCKVSDWEQDYYALYYAGYYSSYYTPWYANTLALHFTQEALDRNDNRDVSTSGPGPNDVEGSEKGEKKTGNPV